MPNTLDDVHYLMGFVLYDKKSSLYRKSFVLYSDHYEITEEEEED